MKRPTVMTMMVIVLWPLIMVDIRIFRGYLEDNLDCTLPSSQVVDGNRTSQDVFPGTRRHIP